MRVIYFWNTILALSACELGALGYVDPLAHTRCIRDLVMSGDHGTLLFARRIHHGIIRLVKCSLQYGIIFTL